MLIPIVELLGLLSKIGLSIDAGSLGKEKLKAKFDKVSPKVVARLNKDKVTPQELSDNNAEKRHLIRSAQLILWKETIRSITGKAALSGEGADVIRDQHDDKVVPAVMPKVNAQMTTADLVKAVAEAELELTT